VLYLYAVFVYFFVCVCMCILCFLCSLCCFPLQLSPFVLWYCWLGLLTCKNRLPYNLYCVGGDVKHCTVHNSYCIHMADVRRTVYHKGLFYDRSRSYCIHTALVLTVYTRPMSLSSLANTVSPSVSTAAAGIIEADFCAMRTARPLLSSHCRQQNSRQQIR